MIFSTFRCMRFQLDFGVMVCLLAIEVGCIHVTNNLLVFLCHLDAELNIFPCSKSSCHNFMPQNWSLFSYHPLDGWSPAPEMWITHQQILGVMRYPICFLSLEGNVTSPLRNIEAPQGVVVNISNTAKASPEAEAPTVAAPIGPVAGAGIMVSWYPIPNFKNIKESKYGHGCLFFVFLFLFYMYMLHNSFIISTFLIYNTCSIIFLYARYFFLYIDSIISVFWTRPVKILH